MNYVISIFVGYILGCLDFAIILSKLYYRKDIRKHGSGNAGATNTTRVFGKLPGALVLILDAGKAVLALYLLKRFLPDVNDLHLLCASIAIIVGHIYPVFFKFKGGKGMSSTFGLMIFLVPKSLLILVPIFLLVLVLKRSVGLSSVVSISCLPIVIGFIQYFARSEFLWQYVITGVIISILVVFAHRENIKSLIKNEELNVENL